MVPSLAPSLVPSAIPAPRPAPMPSNGAATRVGSSAIRDLLTLTGRPGLRSLAGGLPDPATFPVDAIAEATARALRDDPARALQYSPTEGLDELRAWVADHRGVDPAAVLITHGSQQALDLVVRATVAPGDVVVAADPAYVGALQVLRLAGADVVPVPGDDDGLDVDELGRQLAAGLRPRLVYVVADFHNPTGATLSASRRATLAALADRYGFVIVDDDPYGLLRWSGSAPLPLRTITDRVVTLGSVSKILCPGLRVGYVIAPPAIARELVVVKQAADLHTSSLAQHIVATVLAEPGFLDAHVGRLRPHYRDRAVALRDAVRARFGPRLELSAPDGGLFLWARFTDHTDTADRLAGAIDQGVAYVPGPAFAIRQDLRGSMRLSFATTAPGDAADAADRLARAFAPR